MLKNQRLRLRAHLLVMKSLIKFLFTWWNGSTVGTSLYTLFKGTKVGEDYLGNFYYESRDGKNRWCIYSKQSDASRVSPEWNSWLRYVSNKIPSGEKIFDWQKTFNGNKTGLDIAYKPKVNRAEGSKDSLDNYEYDYKAWKPE